MYSKLLRRGWKKSQTIADENLSKYKVQFAGRNLQLNARWKHEQHYLAYIQDGKVNGALAMDVWVFSHLVNKGDVVLDAGANIGFTALLAEKAGAKEVHCFEPDPRLIDRLKAHCCGNTFTIYRRALSNAVGNMEMILSAKHNQGSTLSNRIVDKFPNLFESSERTEVKVETIDNLFCGKTFNFFKVDVEGFELETLEGAYSLLKTYPPRCVYVEAYEEFIVDVAAFLGRFYEYKYRVVADNRGYCRLCPVDSDVSSMETDGIFVNPPSFVYSLDDLSALSVDWVAPVFTGR